MEFAVVENVGNAPPSGGLGAMGGTPTDWLQCWVSQQQAQVDTQRWLLMALADQQMTQLQHLTAHAPGVPAGNPPVASIGAAMPGHEQGPPIRMNKMGPEDDPEAYLNTFEQVATAAGWSAAQWATILTPCLMGLAREAVETLTAVQAADYNMVWTTILETPNISKETYHRRPQEVKFHKGSSIQLMGNRIQLNGLHWLQPATHMPKLEQFLMTLPQSANNWVLCQKPHTLEAAVTAMETYEATTQMVFSTHINGPSAGRRPDPRPSRPRPTGGQQPWRTMMR